jgi:hypothetical protein
MILSVYNSLIELVNKEFKDPDMILPLCAKKPLLCALPFHFPHSKAPSVSKFPYNCKKNTPKLTGCFVKSID